MGKILNIESTLKVANYDTILQLSTVHVYSKNFSSGRGTWRRKARPVGHNICHYYWGHYASKASTSGI